MITDILFHILIIHPNTLHCTQRFVNTRLKENKKTTAQIWNTQ